MLKGIDQCSYLGPESTAESTISYQFPVKKILDSFRLLIRREILVLTDTIKSVVEIIER